MVEKIDGVEERQRLDGREDRGGRRMTEGCGREDRWGRRKTEMGW